MRPRTTDVMVGMKQGFGEQCAHVTATQPIHDPLTLAFTLDEPGEPQFRQVLTGDSRSAAGDRRQARNIKLGVPQRP